jgi:hypothetical protein
MHERPVDYTWDINNPNTERIHLDISVFGFEKLKNGNRDTSG